MWPLAFGKCDQVGDLMMFFQMFILWIWGKSKEK